MAPFIFWSHIMNNTSNAATAVQQTDTPKRKLVAKMAERFGVDASAFWETLKATAFKQRDGTPPTNEQMMALLVVADQYDLNPFTKEIYAFPDQYGGIIPVVGVDGWVKIINNHPQFDGMEFRFSDTQIQLEGREEPIFEWIECVMYRKDRTRPTVIREYLEEIYKAPVKKIGPNGPYIIRGPWLTHTRRFSRHKVIIQTARVAFGYSGIYDQDEAENIIDNQRNVSSDKVVSINQSSTRALPRSVVNEHYEILGELNESIVYNDNDEPLMVNVSSEQLAKETKAIPDKAVAQTDFGPIKAKDKAMIDQMVNYTIQTGAWKATFESFQERYSDKTLAYAELQLANAQTAAKAKASKN
jgi:phage recombination protein Bet